MNSVFIDKKCDSVFYGTLNEFKSSFSTVDTSLFESIITRELTADNEKNVFTRLPSFKSLKDVDTNGVDYVIYAQKSSVCDNFTTINLKNSDYRKFLILADESSELKINVDNNGVNNTDFTFVVVLSKSSNVEFVQVNNSCKDTNNFVYVDQVEGSVFKSFVINYNANNLKNNIKNSLNTPNIESHFYGVSLVDSKESIENNVIVGHFKEQCNSTQHYKAVVCPEGKSLFNGRIYVAKDAQQTEAFQQSNNILLGDGAIARNLPQLEIYADDVKCSHGATTGELDAEAIYYMRQRGIPVEEAKKLQIAGFVSNIVSKISSQELSEQILENVDKKLSSL